MFAVFQLLSQFQLFVTPRTVARQAPLSTGFPRQEHWSGLVSKPASPAMAGGFFIHQGSPCVTIAIN